MLYSPDEYKPVPMALIHEPPHQLRQTIDPERLGELADSMAAEGLHQPIGVRALDGEEAYEIIWGHRRFLAARLLRWPSIPCRVFPVGYDPLLAAISENLQRVDLDPVEEAHAVQKLLDTGRSIAEVARLFRRSHNWIVSRIDLLRYPEDLKTAIQMHGLKLAVADALRDIDHDAYRAELTSEALRTGATGATAHVWRQHYLADRDRIINNHLMVDEVITRREAWIIYYPCDGCRENVDYRDTQTWRFCNKCSHELRTATTATPHDSHNSPTNSSATA